MYGSSRVFAVPITVNVRGREVKLRPRIILHHALIEERILSRRADLLAELVGVAAAFEANEPYQTKLLKEGLEAAKHARWALPEDERQYLSTLPGMAYLLSLQAKDVNSDPPSEDQWLEWLSDDFDELYQIKMLEGLDLRDAHKAAYDAVVDKYMRHSTRASGEDDLGNSTGSSPLSTSDLGASTRDQADTTGLGS
jgi:hypothetical protein